MRDEFLRYYERELTVLRQMGSEFAEKYPKVASRLQLEADKCDDPHVERMIEAFAFLAARIHLKIDDEFPEITESLLSIVYPHYVRPIPSTTVVEFHMDPDQGKLMTGLNIPRASVLYSRPVEGVPCKFRTGYDTTLWPITVADAQWGTPDRLQPPVRAAEAVAYLRIELRCLPDVRLEALKLSSLRFFLSGEGSLVYSLYELLCNNCSRILLRDPTPGSKIPPQTLPASALRPVGFAENEALLPYPRRSFPGYRLLQEYFAFPEKFLFVELSGLESLARFGERAEILFLISPFEQAHRQQVLETGVSSKTLRLGCSPAINLFPQTAEPIAFDQTKDDYPVVPDARRRYSTEIFSIDEVVSTSSQSHEVTTYEPFYSYRHAGAEGHKKAFWHTTRRSLEQGGDAESELYLSLVNLAAEPVRTTWDTLTVRCTCTNRDLPARLPFGNDAGDFELEGVSIIQRVVCLRKPTPTLRMSAGKGTLWRLISHLSLNYLSLAEDGKDAFQEILKLYNFGASPSFEKQIAGITALKSRRHFARVISEYGISFARGTRVEMEVDEEQFVGGGAYLFTSVLENFLGLYASMNSFSQLAVTTRQRKEVMCEWPPRAGQAILM